MPVLIPLDTAILLLIALLGWWRIIVERRNERKELEDSIRHKQTQPRPDWSPEGAPRKPFYGIERRTGGQRLAPKGPGSDSGKTSRLGRHRLGRD